MHFLPRRRKSRSIPREPGGTGHPAAPRPRRGAPPTELEWDAPRLCRRNFQRRRGRTRQVISGIQYNFSFAAEFFSRWRTVTGSTGPRFLDGVCLLHVSKQARRCSHSFEILTSTPAVLNSANMKQADPRPPAVLPSPRGEHLRYDRRGGELKL
ncbi:MAG: hypothetical protein JNL92_13020 [Opitutaceae bacterium]|nr:hypothetical protein [Opitutaceae bacterium]